MQNMTPAHQDAELKLEDEHELIAQAKTNPEAFGELYRCYVKRIYNYHYRHTSDPVEAEDLTSRTFYRALRSIQRYRETGASFQAWLFRIAHNLVANWYRDQGRRQIVSIDGETIPPLATREAGPEEHATTRETQDHLTALIATLPEERKTLLLLKFAEQLSNAEIAAVLGKTEGAIKALYHRTLMSLRGAIPQGVWDDETR